MNFANLNVKNEIWIKKSNKIFPFSYWRGGQLPQDTYTLYSLKFDEMYLQTLVIQIEASHRRVLKWRLAGSPTDGQMSGIWSSWKMKDKHRIFPALI